MYGKYARLRDQKGVTDYRVARDTGITQSTFSDWRAGRSKPKTDKLLKLAEYFGVSIEYFLK
jgi:repressor LexA